MKTLRDQRRAFTLIELLVVITIIAVLASLLLPALVKAKQGALKARCTSNLRQTGLAFHLYLAENNDTFPAANGGRLPEDWIYYNSMSPGPVSRSPIVRYLSGATTNVLKCPADHFFDHPPTNAIGELYPFSYALNDRNDRTGTLIAFVGGGQGAITSSDLDGNHIQGMASAYEFGREYHFRQNMIRVPSSKIMLAESRNFAMVLGPSIAGTRSFSFIDIEGSSWGFRDPISTNHGKSGMTCLGDGHVEAFTSAQAMDSRHAIATYDEAAIH